MVVNLVSPSLSPASLPALMSFEPQYAHLFSSLVGGANYVVPRRGRGINRLWRRRGVLLRAAAGRGRRCPIPRGRGHGRRSGGGGRRRDGCSGGAEAPAAVPGCAAHARPGCAPACGGAAQQARRAGTRRRIWCGKAAGGRRMRVGWHCPPARAPRSRWRAAACLPAACMKGSPACGFLGRVSRPSGAAVPNKVDTPPRMPRLDQGRAGRIPGMAKRRGGRALRRA